jgi:hypothetical protein
MQSNDSIRILSQLTVGGNDAPEEFNLTTEFLSVESKRTTPPQTTFIRIHNQIRTRKRERRQITGWVSQYLSVYLSGQQSLSHDIDEISCERRNRAASQ